MSVLVAQSEAGLNIKYPTFPTRTIIIVGGFGSGKTEIAVNLAKYLAQSETSPITIADLDLVNPYFRSREAMGEMEELGIKVLTPRDGKYFADLPILLPEIKGAIDSTTGKLILDVGGDAQGARALGSLAGEFKTNAFEMLMVLNSRRPQTSDASGCLSTMSRIEVSSKLRFTGLIANSHMIDETDEEVIREGFLLAESVSRSSGLPLRFMTVRERLLDSLDTAQFDCAIFPLTRSMLKPWERRSD